MRTEKMNSKQISLSLFLFVISYVILLELLFLFTLFNEWRDVATYLSENVDRMVTLCACTAILCGLFYCYLFFENRAILQKPAKIIELFSILGLQIIFSYIIGKFISPTARPAAFLSLMCITLIGRRESLFFTVIYAIMQFIIDRYSDISVVTDIESFSFLITVFCSGTVGIFVARRMRTRLQSVMLGVVLLVPTLINVALVEVISGQIEGEVRYLQFLYGGMDCLFSTVLFLVCLPVMEFIFSELTVFRLRELTSDEAKLIKRLKTEASGTYHHTVTVAQIVESCAREIGENAELARACAYYHDVGKLKNPEMFTENQTDFNIHNELAPEISVDIIRSHAKDGADLIRKNHLPEFFSDIAMQHHGTLPVKYFYAKALKMSDGELNPEDYSYSGPTPRTKIAAIVMIVDASEAAARSLSVRSVENVEALVRNLIEERIDLGQFEECNITMYELTVIKRTIVSQLTGVYHSRVAYPRIKISKKN
jgi:hypothetical protein